MDERDLDLVPAFLVDGNVLYRKFLETKYNQDVQALNRCHVEENYSFSLAASPAQPVASQRLADFEEFLRQAELPDHWQVLGGIRGYRTVPEKLRELRDRLADRYHDDLAAFARDSGIPASNWNTITLVPPAWHSKQYDYQSNVMYETYFELLHEAPPAERQLVSLSGYFLDLYSKVRRKDGSGGAARAFSFEGFALPRSLPGKERPLLRKYWLQFVREDLNPSFLVLTGTTGAEYQQFLKDRYGTVDAMNRSWGAEVRRFEDIDLPNGAWLKGTQRKDYEDFMAPRPPESYRLVGPEYAWRDWLAVKYDSVEALNRAHEADYAAFAQAPMSVAELEYRYATDHASELRKTYAGRNFVNVFREL
ncbi:MAG: beta-galactosidase, partial [Phycisphaerae bacterium]|nr:beta-galactosidase [Phycisphaerae bacterium]